MVNHGYPTPLHSTPPTLWNMEWSQVARIIQEVEGIPLTWKWGMIKIVNHKTSNWYNLYSNHYFCLLFYCWASILIPIPIFPLKSLSCINLRLLPLTYIWYPILENSQFWAKYSIKRKRFKIFKPQQEGGCHTWLIQVACVCRSPPCDKNILKEIFIINRETDSMNVNV